MWGNAPLPSGSPTAPALRSALARERALNAARRRGDVIHRLPPSELRGGRVRNRTRAWLLSGALIESGPGAGSGRIVDAAAHSGGIGEPVTAVRRSAAGGALVFGTLATGQDVLLRVAGSGWPGDPRPGHEALRGLGERDLVPRAVDAGEVARASWTLETALPGARPRVLDATLAAAVSRFSARLPRASGPPRSVEHDLSALALLLPSRADRYRMVAARADELATEVQGVTRHGDLWLGNLLIAGGALSGVVDWDAWHVAGVPGADILHLYGTDMALATRRELGDIWVGAPWRSDAFRSFAASYWSELRTSASEDALLLAGIAWWAAAVAGTLARAPHRASHERWVAANVDRVLERIPQL